MRLALALALAFALAACNRGGDSRAPAASSSPPCESCHLAEYRGAPHHVNEKPTTCHVCHGAAAWHPTVRNHRWPLTGAHASVTCFACHRGTPPVFDGLSTACVACHRDDYVLHTFPAHQQYPTTCADCHTTTAWRPATSPPEPLALPAAPNALAVDAGAPHHHERAQPGVHETPALPSPTPMHPESAFPIATGHHAGIACGTCHDQGGTMGRGNTDCVQCHARDRYDGIHDGVPGYPQGDAAANFCVDCHRHGTRSRF